MSKTQIIVDRIENGFAICEIGNTTKDIPLDKINGAVHEGDILYTSENGACYLIDRKETENRHAAIKDRFERLKARSKQSQ
jgi:hypothetical protein